MKICVFAGGKGTNFQKILENCKSGYLQSEIVLLVTNNLNCGAADIARNENIEIFHVSNIKFSELSERQITQRLSDKLKDKDVDFIVLAGYMKKISDELMKEYRNRIINIHPSLLPLFGGKGMYGDNVHKAVLESDAKVSGITIHFVEGDYDSGGIILQKQIEIAEDETLESLKKKISTLEHKYYSEVIKQFELGGIMDINGKVKITKA